MRNLGYFRGMNRIEIILLVALMALGCSRETESETVPAEDTEVAVDTIVPDTTPRVTGIGGIFFKSEDPAALSQWYYDALGLAPNDYGSMFEFREGGNPDQVGYLQWSPFDRSTTYFEPSDQEYMINYRVYNMEALVDQLERDGVTILDSIECYEYGCFVHILDPQGNKVELWEPIDNVFTGLYEGATTK